MAKREMKPKAPGNGSGETENQHGDLKELFLDELADIYSAEKQLTKALPKMAKAADSDQLREAFESHLAETEQQITRLEEVAENLGEELKNKKCKGMEGLIEEGEDMMKEMKDSSALDAALIASAQKVEHYEIASYGTLCAWAERMGHDEVLQLLKQTMGEEESADERLTEIAESLANEEAQQS